MKKIFTLIFVIYTSIIISQNWNLLNSQERYHYKTSYNDFYSNTILTDSIYSVGLDTFLFMNTICKPCDTCSIAGTYLAYQPQFLNKIVKKENNGWYHFYLPDTFHIKTDGYLNDTWIYKIKNIDTTFASVISVDTLSIFTINDSIKTILLSSGDTIVFSKNHGLLTFVSDTIKYSLIGLENSNLGFVLPTNKEFYNFNVGDSFFYYGGIGTSGSTSPYENYNTYKKVYILSKTVTDTSIIYNTYFVKKMTSWFSPSNLGTSTGYETLTYKTNLPKYNIYNNKLLEYNINAYIHKILLINNRIMFTYSTKELSRLDTIAGNIFIVPQGFCVQHENDFITGLGNTSINGYACLSSFSATKLICFNDTIINTSVSVDCNDYYLINSIENHFNDDINISYNENTIKIENRNLSKISFSIFDNVGREILTENRNEATIELNTISFSNGIFYLKVADTKNQYQTFKFVKY